MLPRMANKNNTQSKIAAILREQMGRQRITAAACSTRGETRCRVIWKLNLVGKYRFGFALLNVRSFWPHETRQDGDDNNERDTDDNLEPSYLAALLKKLALAQHGDGVNVSTWRRCRRVTPS